MMRRTPLALAVALLCAVAGSLVKAQSRRETGPFDVWLVGSSSVNGALGMLIEAEVERSGMQVRRDGRPSTGLSRPDFYDWEAQIPRLGDLPSMRGVLVYLGGNDAQAFRLRDSELPAGTPESRRWIQFRDEARWSEAYRQRVHRFVDALCAAGARKVVVIPPVDGDQAGHAARIRRVQRLQVEGTQGTRCGVVADASGVRLGPELAGDGVHLNRAGARAVWEHIGSTILGALR